MSAILGFANLPNISAAAAGELNLDLEATAQAE
jgi:hypothetical protein